MRFHGVHDMRGAEDTVESDEGEGGVFGWARGRVDAPTEASHAPVGRGSHTGRSLRQRRAQAAETEHTHAPRETDDRIARSGAFPKHARTQVQS